MVADSDLVLACAGRSCSWLWDRVVTAALLSGWLWGASWQQGSSCMPGISGKALASESAQLQSGFWAAFAQAPFHASFSCLQHVVLAAVHDTLWPTC